MYNDLNYMSSAKVFKIICSAGVYIRAEIRTYIKISKSCREFLNHFLGFKIPTMGMSNENFKFTYVASPLFVLNGVFNLVSSSSHLKLMRAPPLWTALVIG